jgi:hypothetical protein
VLSAALGAVSFAAYMNESGRYLRPSLIVIALYVVIAVTVILAFAALFLFPRSNKVSSEQKWVKYTLLLPIASLLPIIAAAAKTVDAAAWADESKRLAFIISILIFATAIISLCYFISIILSFKGSVSAILGYFFIIFCILVIATLHMDYSFEMNSPFKVTVQFAAAFTALSALSDIRNQLDRPSAKQYVLSKLCCLVFNALSLIGSIFAHSRGYGSEYLTYSIFFTSCALCSSIEFFTSKVSEHRTKEDEAQDTDSSIGTVEADDPSENSIE